MSSDQESRYEISRDAMVEPEEIGALRESVGWDGAEESYRVALPRRYARYTCRDDDGLLIGFLSVLSDGVADAFLLDLVVSPSHQRKGLGRALVGRALTDAKRAGIRAVHVTFDSRLEGFYRHCGFHLFRGGIVEFDRSGSS